MSNRVITLHPDPNGQGSELDKDDYTSIRGAIEMSFHQNGSMEYQTIFKSVEERLSSISNDMDYQIKAVLLDMQARGLISKIPSTNPHLYSVVKNG